MAYFKELRKPEPNEAPIHGGLCPFCRQMDNERLPTLRLRRQASLAEFGWIECLRLPDMTLSRGMEEGYRGQVECIGAKILGSSFTDFASKRIDGISGLDRALILCELDRAGVGTFLPNDEKNRHLLDQR